MGQALCHVDSTPCPCDCSRMQTQGCQWEESQHWREYVCVCWGDNIVWWYQNQQGRACWGNPSNESEYWQALYHGEYNGMNGYFVNVRAAKLDLSVRILAFVCLIIWLTSWTAMSITVLRENICPHALKWSSSEGPKHLSTITWYSLSCPSQRALGIPWIPLRCWRIQYLCFNAIASALLLAILMTTSVLMEILVCWPLYTSPEMHVMLWSILIVSHWPTHDSHHMSLFPNPPQPCNTWQYKWHQMVIWWEWYG